MIQVPRLSKGKGYKGPEFYGCCNTGMAPAIFHSRTGKYIVGPEMRCRDAMRDFVLLGNKRTVGTGRDKCWIFKGRAGAVKRFMSLCGAAILMNDKIRKEHIETAAKARAGDMSAILALGDY